MRTKPCPLVLLHAGTAFRDLVRRAAAEEFALVEVRGWSALAAVLRAEGRRCVAVLDPYWGTGDRGLAPQLPDLLGRFPYASFVVTLEVTTERAADIRQLNDWGVGDIVAERHYGVGGIRTFLHGARARPTARLLQQAIPPWLPARAFPIVANAAYVAAEGGDLDGLLEALGTASRTLAKWCEAARLPPPTALLSWFRILCVVESLESGVPTLDRVALHHGYASVCCLEQELHARLGTGSAELRQPQARATALAAFRRFLESARRNPMERLSDPPASLPAP